MLTETPVQPGSNPAQPAGRASSGRHGPEPGPARRRRRPQRRTVLLLLGAVVLVVAAGLTTCVLIDREDNAPSIVGTWRDTWKVEQTGRNTFVGIGLSDAVEPDSGCLYKAGETEWRIGGQPPTYQGSERWVKGSNGRNCEFAWARATFTLLDAGQTVQVCSTSPWNAAQRLCRNLSRTDGPRPGATRGRAAPGRSALEGAR